MLLALASGAWTLGESIWAVYDLVLREEVPVPSWADVGYLSGIPLAVAALLAHPALRGTGVRQARAVVDGLLVATSLLFLSWTFVLGPLWESTDLTTAGGLVALGYPFGDVVIVLFMVLAVRGITREGRLPLWLLLGGLLAMALAETPMRSWSKPIDTSPATWSTAVGSWATWAWRWRPSARMPGVRWLLEASLPRRRWRGLWSPSCHWCSRSACSACRCSSGIGRIPSR